MVDCQALAEDLRATDQGKSLLICWHHGAIPELLHALGAVPTRLLPNGEWSNDAFNWVIILRYDAEGRIIPNRTRRIKEQWAR